MIALAAAAHVLVAAALAAPPPAAAYADTLIAAARTQHLAASRDWQVLLHYKRTLWGGWQSEADGGDFFLAGKNGRTDPAAELEASLRALTAEARIGDQHAQCRFPARWEWLKTVLAIDPGRAPDRPCPILETWRTGISPEAATLVYATAYLNSPASMYGHTFLRLYRSTGEGNPLLDYVINFAADVDTENGVLYAIKGVAGLFPGRFYVMPYYVKVQEYSNMESRDLWEYELALSPAQVRRLMLHAWETRNTYFRYYFFTRNCSYHLLALIEAANPALRLTEGFAIAHIPSDTVRTVLAQRGLVRRVTCRPSLLSVMKQRKEQLSNDEVRAAESWLATPPPTAPVPRGAEKPRQALVIDAAYDYLRFKEGVRAQATDDFKRRERVLLLARGRLGVPPQEVAAAPYVGAPDAGHATARVMVGGGASNDAGAFGTLAIRGAIHDYLDPTTGYPPDARLHMGELRLRFEDTSSAPRLDRADVIDIVSAAPLDRWVHGASWKVWFGADNARELGCERADAPNRGWRCLYAGVITGGGLALRFGPRESLMLVLLAETDLALGPAFSGAGYGRAGAGGEALLTGGTRDRWRFELGARYAYYLLGARGSNLRARATQAIMLTRSFAFRFGVETAGGLDLPRSFLQGGAELAAYF